MMNRPLFRSLVHWHLPLGTLAAVSILLTGCGKKQPDGTAKGGTATAPWPGYTLVQELGSSASELIDMEGRLVHRWPGGYPTGGSAFLRPDGSLLRVGILQPNAFNAPCPGMSGAAEIVDWNGNQTWTFEFARSTATLHHDIVPMPNGNILMIGVEKKTKEEQLEAGRDPARMRVEDMWFDFLIEVKPTGRLGGEIIWEWRAWDHLVQDFDPKKKNYGVVADHPDKIDINFIEENVLNQGNAPIDRLRSLGYVSGGNSGPQAGAGLPDWSHVNSVAYNPETNEILMSARDMGEIWIIRHGVAKDAKDGGIIYRWGNPQAYQRGTPKDRKLFGQHDAHWIAPGLQGAGNILFFNNGEGRKSGMYSTIDEFKAPRKSDGTYELEEGGAYGPEELAWQYVANPKEAFFSQFLSGVQRLPNGNTLVCSGVEAKVFEVTTDGIVVWKKEYLDAKTVRDTTASGPGRGPGGGAMGQPQRPQPAGAHGLTAAEIAFLMGPDSPFSPPRPSMDGPDMSNLPPGMAGGPGGMGGGPGGMGGGPGGMGGGPGGMGGGPGGMGGGPDMHGGTGVGGRGSAVRKGLFRAVRYSLDHPAFKGRKLRSIDSSQ